MDRAIWRSGGWRNVRWLSLFCTLVLFVGKAMAADEPPTDWIDPKTGHRVVQLSREPESASLYFHQHPFSADGKKLIFTAPSGIWTVDLETHERKQIVKGQVGILLTGRKSGDVYYIRRSKQGEKDVREEYHPQGDIRPRTESESKAETPNEEPNKEEERREGGRRRRGRGWGGGNVYATNLDTLEERHVAKLPEKFGGGNVAVNADETLLVAIGRDPEGKPEPRELPNGTGEGRLTPNWKSGEARCIYTIDLKSGYVHVIHRSHDWLNHLQCSPTDPEQFLFCHEGPWHFVDRTWIMRTDGTGLTQVHPRTMDMEIGGHEYFSNDGKTVWYDLQTPRSLVFWLAGYEIATGKRTWYHHERDEWSVHYNVSPDGKLFAGDGGGPASVANRSPSGEDLDPPQNGQWIYLFRPELIKMSGLKEQAEKQVKVGVFNAEKLVDMSKHDYDLEPNVIFTPDGKWIVFRSNMRGDKSQVYAVEVAKANVSVAKAE
jgi:oligogalacturonide lyase